MIDKNAIVALLGMSPFLVLVGCSTQGAAGNSSGFVDTDAEGDSESATDTDTDSDNDSDFDNDNDSGDEEEPSSDTDAQDKPRIYAIGAGIHDTTGTPVEAMFAGYCDFDQKGQGIRMRTRSRAFIIDDSENAVVFVSVDAPLMSTGVYVDVLEKLNEEFGGIYNESNVIVSVTHTHSAPGGFFRTYLLNVFAGMGFNETTYRGMVDGIFQSIVKAHNNLQPGIIGFNSTEAPHEIGKRLNFNRSPQAYYQNYDIEDYKLPNGEFDDTNRTLSRFTFTGENGTPIGAYHWLPVHPNMAGSHLFLIDGDVNGLASYRLEKANNTDYTAEQTYVAAFAYNNAGDTSSNLPEDVDIFKALYPNENLTRNEKGHWIADGTHDYERIARRTDTVMDLLDAMATQDEVLLSGPIETRQLFVHMPGFKIRPEFIDEEI